MPTITLHLSTTKLFLMSFSVAISLALFGRHFFPYEGWMNGFGTGWAASVALLVFCSKKQKQEP